MIHFIYSLARALRSSSPPHTKHDPDCADFRTGYPPIEAYETGFLQVSDLHNIYWEQSGNPSGNPVVVLHGGPGGGCPPSYRTYFDPAKYRIIMFDQRGAGQSLPFAEVRACESGFTYVRALERFYGSMMSMAADASVHNVVAADPSAISNDINISRSSIRYS